VGQCTWNCGSEAKKVATVRRGKEITKHMAPGASYTQQTMQPGRSGRKAANEEDCR